MFYYDVNFWRSFAPGRSFVTFRTLFYALLDLIYSRMTRMSLFLSAWAGPGIAEGPGRPVPDNETAEAPTVGEYGDAETVNHFTTLNCFHSNNVSGICILCNAHVTCGFVSHEASLHR